MSNLALTAAAQLYAEQQVKKFLKDYNSGQLTDKGKREILTELPMFAFLAGYSSSDLGEAVAKAYNFANRAMNCFSNDDLEGANKNLQYVIDLLHGHVAPSKFDIQLENTGTKRILVNGLKFDFGELYVSYNEVVQMAYGITAKEDSLYVVMFNRADEGDFKQGIMEPGDIVNVEEGMVFGVQDVNNQ